MIPCYYCKDDVELIEGFGLFDVNQQFYTSKLVIFYNPITNDYTSVCELQVFEEKETALRHIKRKKDDYIKMYEENLMRAKEYIEKNSSKIIDIKLLGV